MSTYHNTAIVFGDLKNALLYFDHIIPLNVSGIFTGYSPTDTGPGKPIRRSFEMTMETRRELQTAFGKPEDIIKLFPPELAGQSEFEKVRNMFEGLLMMYMVKTIEGQEIFEKYVRELAKIVQANEPTDANLHCPTLEQLQLLFAIIVNKYNLKNVPVDCSHFFLGNSSNDNSDNCLSAPQIRIVDTSKTSINQIMEFRKDKEVMNKMRKFRLFAYEQYTGKDKAFIEDDLQKRLADHDEAVKTWGFGTKIKTLSFLLESKVLMGTLATSAASLLIGNATLAAEAFGAGTIIELGKLSLEYSKSRSELRKICGNNPISYLADTKKALEK